MIAYIQGNIVELTPTYVVLENNQIGYHVNISLHTYSQIQNSKTAKLFIYQYLKESIYPTLYGFANPFEKKLFLQFISVSGVGTNTARMILSSYSPTEIQQAVISGDVALIKSIKGIGVKTAQRLIIELADKFAKDENAPTSVAVSHNTNANEALKALRSLGFAESAASKAIKKALQQQPDIDTVETLIKKSLKNL
ncbi:UNVERIFIED_CONTAM: hypothetical protein GTU68_032765 [Idotea baltica]|nr:hypothetical protein [Idotea baltica]